MIADWRAVVPSSRPLKDRFWEKVKPSPTGCWMWTSALSADGYGVITFQARTIYAHRVSWFLEHGKWPTKSVLHRCDVPACVRPLHLFEGSQKENILDCVAKGRLTSAQLQKTHCPSGHQYTEENIYRRSNGSRSCRLRRHPRVVVSNSSRRLLPFAIQRIRVITEELALSHTNPVSKEIEPSEVRLEVAENLRWLKQAEAEIA